ncbi:MAG: hypothetical protein Q8K55_14085 [Gemmatimonadaceae bacterium]|nr:hypothetical protein [Gemmatimonadaceae bacterium]
MRNFVSHHISAAAIGALLIAGAASATPARAQGTDARWQPWLGCWTQVSETRPTGAETGAKGMVCVVPAQTGNGVEVAVMADGKLVRSELIAATNERVQKTIESCPGWETVGWSADGRRLLVRSEVRCAQSAVKSSSIFSISSEGEWIEVRGALVGVNSTVSVVRYRPAAFALKRVATEVGGEPQPFTVVSEVGVSSRFARLAAGDRVDADAVLDVAKHVDSPVAEAWLNELQQGFDLDARELVRIADAGMPPNVIDLMVALSNPEEFAVRRNAEQGQNVREVRRGTFGEDSYGRSRRYGSVYDCGYGYMPTTYGYYGDPCYPGYFGYGAYGYGSGYYGYGYPYGYGTYGGYYYGSRPLIIVPAGTYTDQQRGQAVKGGGYTRRGGGTTTTTSRPQSSGTSRDAAPSSGSSTGSSSGSSTSSGSTGSSGGDGGRTAKPRVPPGG